MLVSILLHFYEYTLAHIRFLNDQWCNPQALVYSIPSSYLQTHPCSACVPAWRWCSVVLAESASALLTTHCLTAVLPYYRTTLLPYRCGMREHWASASTVTLPHVTWLSPPRRYDMHQHYLTT